ncbi:hypothetical protein NM688_g2914 [Phlebia brevispora]|uniref:Uncharacterized protein n=1 Tax=Phlebia brevispora TaxID=194682 RepID=A0ACC1T758_9APHY|nr:hypothetical protein NM688_g2914 [Phlebia brevispora]
MYSAASKLDWMQACNTSSLESTTEELTSQSFQKFSDIGSCCAWCEFLATASSGPIYLRGDDGPAVELRLLQHVSLVVYHAIKCAKGYKEGELQNQTPHTRFALIIPREMAPEEDEKSPRNNPWETLDQTVRGLDVDKVRDCKEDMPISHDHAIDMLICLLGWLVLGGSYVFPSTVISKSSREPAGDDDSAASTDRVPEEHLRLSRRLLEFHRVTRL